MKKVLMTDHPWPDVDIERSILAEVPAELIEAPTGDAATLARLAGEAEAIMTCWAKVPREVIDAAPRCHTISRMGIGLDNIDVTYATSRGIVVTNVPDYCFEEVAEHTIALLFSLARKVALYHHQSKSGRYDLNEGPELRRIAGQTLGIVGLGQIGCRVAEKALALGLKVVAHTLPGSPTVPGVGLTSFDELLATADYVTLHAPLTESTRHLISRDALAKMKPTAYLINTARGGLLDSTALAAALAENRLAGAALDVQEQEPPDLGQPPYNDRRVIVTPHAAFLSAESLENLRHRVARQVADRLLGRVPENVVNREVLGK